MSKSTIDDFYHNPRSAKQIENVKMFLSIYDRFEWMKFRQPNKEKSPWLWQGYIPTVSGESIVVNFWPHKGRAMQEDGKPVTGYEAIRRLISEAIEESADDFEVLDQ